MFKRFFDNRAKDLLDLYDATKSLDHAGEKGMLRELVLRRLVVSVLPPHFGIGTGIVVDKWDRQSRQADLIVYDKRRLPPLFLEECRGIFPFDAVMRVIEVKSMLDKRGLTTSFEAFRLFDPDNPSGLKMATKGKLDGGQSIYPVTCLFAYDTNIADFAAVRSQIVPEKVDSFRFFCVVTRGTSIGDSLNNILPSKSREQTVRRFVSLTLQCLESEASSRKDYSTVEWLLD